MKSYLNDPQLKKDFLREIVKHRKADIIEQGSYGNTDSGEWKGCAIACSLRSLAIINGEKLVTEYDQHKRYETDLGIPEWLARLEDKIFEGLEAKEAKMWPERFAKAIPVGVDLDPIKWSFCAFILKENIDCVLKLKGISDELKEQVAKAIKGVLVLHENAIKTGEWDEKAAESAAEAAWSAAGAAESAARSTGAAWSAAGAAASAAEAAWSAAGAAESAARSTGAAESTAYKRYAKELLRLLKEIK